MMEARDFIDLIGWRRRWPPAPGHPHSECIRQADVSNVISCYCWVSQQSNAQLAIMCASARLYKAMQEKDKQ